MSATAAVAIIGAVATPAVAIAGFVFNHRRAQADRAATRELAHDTHTHELQLAEGQREHEQELRRKERLFDARRETYVDVLRQFLVEVQIVDRRENPASSREPPEMPPEHEWTDLRARVGALGSKDVVSAVDSLDSKVREFHEAVDRLVSETRPKSRETRGPYLDGLRRGVREGYEKVQTLIGEELEAKGGG